MNTSLRTATELAFSETRLLVAEITPQQLMQQHALPNRLGADEFVARLSAARSGASSVVIAALADGKACDRIVMKYGPAGSDYERTWEKAAETSTGVDYRLLADTSSRGYASAER
jgi:hypothetical protein